MMRRELQDLLKQHATVAITASLTPYVQSSIHTPRLYLEGRQ
jgi:hypothetical protein